MGQVFYCHLITSNISFLFLSLGLDTGKVGIGGNQGASAPGRKQVRESVEGVRGSQVG